MDLVSRQVSKNADTENNRPKINTNSSQTITWDMENRLVSVNSATFVYDGDGKRVMKTDGGETILYVNKYYEKLAPFTVNRFSFRLSSE